MSSSVENFDYTSWSGYWPQSYGWTCGTCNVYVPWGIFHQCVPVNAVPVVWDRTQEILDRLDRIAEALETLTKERP